MGVVAQPIDGGRSQQPVARKGLIPLGEVEVAGHDGGTMGSIPTHVGNTSRSSPVASISTVQRCPTGFGKSK